MNVNRKFSNGLKKWSRVVAAGGLIVALAACSGQNSAPAEESGDDGGLTTVRTTVIPALGMIPYQVAQEQGFFADNGLEVEATEGLDFTSWIQALDTQFDIITLTVSTFLPATAAGIEMNAFAGVESFDEDVNATVLLTNKPGINSVEDLAREGSTIAVSRVSDLTEWFYEQQLQGTGESTDGIRLVAVPPGDMADQLRNGVVDAAQMSPGFSEALIDEGYTILAEYLKSSLVDVGADLPIAWTHFASSAKFAEENPETVEAFQTAIEQATDWVAENPEETIKIYADWVGADYETVKDLEIPGFKNDVEVSDFEPWITFMEEGNLLDGPVNPEDLVPSYFRGA